MDKLTHLLSASLVLLLLVSVHTTVGEQLLPDTVCLYCTLLFRRQGCLETETPFCKLLAYKFTIDLGENRFCDNYLCEPGYGQNNTGRSCTAVLACPVTKLRLNGICPTNQVCCAN